jgi:hypothetical protein
LNHYIYIHSEIAQNRLFIVADQNETL